MDQPQNPQLAALLASVDDMRAAEARLKEMKDHVNAVALKLADIPDKNERILSAIYAYWMLPEVNASPLSFAATGRQHPSALLKIAGPVFAGIECDKCKGNVPVGSRSEMKELLDRISSSVPRWAEGYRVLCSVCIDEVMEARDRESEETDRARRRHAITLQAIPYVEYLQTDDWGTARDRHIENLVWMTKTEPGCEVCHAMEKRGVYHTSLDALGLRDELIMLCTSCKDSLSPAGKIAGMLGPGNLVADTHVAFLTGKSEADAIWQGIDSE